MEQKDTDIEQDSKSDSDTGLITDTQTPRTTGRVRKKPKYLEDYECAAQSSELTVDYCYRATVGLPQTYKEAIASPMSEKWKKAMEDEMVSFKENNTYSLVPLPEGRQTVGGRWAKYIWTNPKVSRLNPRMVHNLCVSSTNPSMDLNSLVGIGT